MQRTALAERTLPDYTRAEERFNMISHIVGGGMGIAATVLCVIAAALEGNVYGVVSGAIFGASMVALYTISSVYHGLHGGTGKKVMQILDHCTIYFLIAGTYTPFCLCTIREHNPALGWGTFGFVWALAVVGIVLNAIDLKRFQKVSMVLYLGMGWCIILTGKLIVELLGGAGFALLVGGGVAYTVGAVFYGLGHKKRYIHSVFHLFCLVGSALHILCILFYVI
ncbi:MAG: hemolysin III family protein [Oscillospiraceae bacterium]|nr:hemolysin III family protein [Oscillospiraceae bacterium]